MTDTNEYKILKEDTDYKYICDTDNNTYTIDKETDEVKEAIYTLVPVGSITYTPAQQKAYKERQAKERALNIQKDANSDLGKFFFAANDEEFEGLTPETAARLIYLNTYLSYDKENVLMLSKGKEMHKKDLEKVLKLSRSAVGRFWAEVCPQYVRETEDGLITTDKNIFRRGSLSKKKGELWRLYRRVYVNGVRTLYEKTEVSKHRHLGYLFKMLPFINMEYNILCTNPLEMELDEIERLTLAEFCKYIGYDYSKSGRLLKIYKELVFDVNGHKERFCSFNYDGCDRSMMGIYVNPRILYSGTDYRKVEILGAFCREIEKKKDIDKP